MLDALLPAAAALEDGARQGQKLQPTKSAAVAAAQAGVEATVTMRPRPGRSSYLGDQAIGHQDSRSAEHTSELPSLMRISNAVFCLKKKQFQFRHHQESIRRQA